ncbi:MAG: hypothetical protein K1000chlam2_00467, partial [Chlamydiae bacterium]|nr:hypothetical protein [Chlamydiota bacterium]
MTDSISSTLQYVQIYWKQFDEKIDNNLNSIINNVAFSLFNKETSEGQKNKIKLLGFALLNNLVWKNDLKLPYSHALKIISILLTMKGIFINSRKEYQSSSKLDLQIQMASVASDVGLTVLCLNVSPFEDTYVRSLAKGNLSFPVISVAAVMSMPFIVVKVRNACKNQPTSQRQNKIEETIEDEDSAQREKNVFSRYFPPSNWKITVFKLGDFVKRPFSTQG